MQSKGFTLKNGLRVYVYPRPGLESVGIAVGVKYGSIDDRAGINGAAHYLEHMLFKGTKTRSTNDIKQEVRDMGVNWNAFTTFETTVYYMQGYSGYFGRMADILSDMIINSVMQKEEFELERGPVINEKLIHQDNPRFFFYDNFGKVLYKKHPARLPVAGSRETIEHTRREDLLHIYNSYYTPKNTIVVVYGNISIASAKKTIGKCFGPFKRKYVKPSRPLADEPQVRDEHLIRRENLKQARVGIGFKTAPSEKASAKEIVTLMVISKMLSYRLFDEVRDRKGLSYDPSASYYPFSTFGFIGAQAGVEPQKVEEAKRIIIGEFRKLEDGEVTEEEVGRAKSGLSIQCRMQRESSQDMVNTIASYAIITGDYRFAEKIPDLVKGVSLADVKECSRKYLKTGSYSMVVLRPA